MSNITSINTVQSAAATQTANKPSPAISQQVATKAASLRVDKAAISNHSLLVAKAVSVSDVRTDKVASLRQAITDGTYNVSSSDVAGSVINSLLG